MGSWVKTAGITVGVLLVLGVVEGGITKAGKAGKASKSVKSTVLRDLDWWENTVIYQIYPRSFKDSDGDGIGDLKGITSELEHIVDAGIGTIWLCPIFSSPMVDFGYDISDFYNIHYEYGTMADFDELVEKAHQLGIKVLLDYVPNHASTESIYFKNSESRLPGYEDYFIWADPIVDPNNATNRLVPSNWISQFGGSAWEWSDIRQQYYLHQFATPQADFNFRNAAVREEMLNIMRFWFDKGVDGFRLDALPYIFETTPTNGVYPDEALSGNPLLSPGQLGYTTQIYIRDLIEVYDVMVEWRQFSDSYQEQYGTDTKLLLAEAYTNVSMTMRYYGNLTTPGAHFPFNFDFITRLTASSNAKDFAYVIQSWLTYMPAGHVANWVFGNHDNHRMATRFRDNMVDGLNGLNMILPGVAVTYQGEEIGMRDGYVSWEDTVDVNAKNKGNAVTYLKYSRDPVRTPYQWNNSTSAGFSTNTTTWLPVAADYVEINLAKQKDDTRSHYKVYQALVSLRQEPALSHGEFHIQPLSDNTLVVVRYLRANNTYALVFNVGTSPDTVDLSSVRFLAKPVAVVTSSIESSRVAGTPIEFGEITLQPGESFVLKAAPTFC